MKIIALAIGTLVASTSFASEPAAPAAKTGAAHSEVAKATTTAATGMTGAVTLTADQIKTIQTTLKVPTTGKIDDATTTAAVKKYQQEKNLTVSGIVDTATAAAMGVTK